MSVRRAAKRSRAVRLASRIYNGLTARLAPITRRIAAANRTLLRVVRGSSLHSWLTAEPDPEVIVIDLRETYTIAPVLALLDRVAPVVGASRLATVADGIADRIAAAPARAAGAALCLALSASLLVTIATGDLSAPVYLFHALGLCAGLVAFRERRNAEALAESPVWGPLLALFAPPPPPDEGESGDR